MKYWLIGAASAATIALTSTFAFAETTLKVTLQLPETHSLGKNWQAFNDIISEKSGGELKIQLFPSAQLFADQEVPEAVGSGAIDAGSTFLGRFAGTVPAVDVVSIPFIFKNEAHLRAAVAPGSDLRKTLDAAIEKETNAKVLWWQAFGRNIYLNNDAAIRTPADMKGKKVRTYGKVHGWTVEALGGAPTLMSGSKQFLAYQQGAVDVGMTGSSAVKSRKLYEVMDHMTLTFDAAIEFIAVINKDVYDGLSDEHKAIIDSASLEVEQQLRDEIYEEEAMIVEEMKSLMTVVELTDEEKALWETATKPVVQQFIDETGDVGKAVIAAVAAASN